MRSSVADKKGPWMHYHNFVTLAGLLVATQQCNIQISKLNCSSHVTSWADCTKYCTCHHLDSGPWESLIW